MAAGPVKTIKVKNNNLSMNFHVTLIRWIILLRYIPLFIEFGIRLNNPGTVA